LVRATVPLDEHRRGFGVARLGSARVATVRTLPQLAIELLYGLSFITFGLSDYREAYVLQSWLILLKAANLVALLWLRRIVIRRFYPQRKTF